MMAPETTNIEAEERICAKCTHLVGRRSLFESAIEWKCHHQFNLLRADKDLVTGQPVYQLKYTSCYTAREEGAACGPLGLWFEPYVRPTVYDYINKSKPIRNADDLLKELE